MRFDCGTKCTTGLSLGRFLLPLVNPLPMASVVRGMSVPIATTCRLVLHHGARQVDLVVPVDVPVGDLLPAVVDLFGADLASSLLEHDGLEHDGWVLQRLGHRPLDEDATVAEAALLDGESLHLRPRADQLPPMDFDDLIDGIAVGVATRSGRWGRWMARPFALGAAAPLLLLAAVVAVRVGPWSAAAVLVLLTCVAAVWRWPLYDLLTTRALAAVVVLASVFLAADVWGNSPEHRVTAASSLGTLAILILDAAVLAIAVSGRPGALLAVMLLLSGGLALAMAALGVSWTVIATALVFLHLTVRPIAPVLAFSVAGLRLPAVPLRPEDLAEGTAPEPGAELLRRAAVADRCMTAMSACMGTVVAVGCLQVALTGGPWGALTGLLASCHLALSVRLSTSLWHRLFAVLPLSTTVAAAVLRWTDVDRGVVASAVLLLSGAAVLWSGHVLSRRRITPFWGRMADTLQLITGLAMLPVALLALGTYGAIRAVVP